MADNGKSTAWIGVVGAVAVALIGGVVAILTTRPPSGPTPVEVPPLVEVPKPGSAGGDVPGIAVMGQLESGVNLQGMDFSAFGAHAENAPLCAEMCRTNKDCKAMTFVISQKSCWLKGGVPPALPPGGSDYVSSVKQ